MNSGKPAFLLSNRHLKRRLQAELSDCTEEPPNTDNEETPSACTEEPPNAANEKAASALFEPSMDNFVDIEDDAADQNYRHWFDEEEFNEDFLVEDDKYMDNNLSGIPENFNSITIELAEWAIESGLGRDKLNKLLGILNRHKIDVPKTARTLLRTPIRKIVTRHVNPGEYYHFGIEKNLLKLNYEFLYNLKEVEVDIGIDGLPLFKSSNLQLWPILGAFVDKKNILPFIIGVYSGTGKPENIDHFLLDFVNEIKVIISEGVRVTPDKLKKKFKIRSFICDAPAKSFVMGIVGHNSFNGCPKCNQVGTYINRTVAYSTTVSELYSDITFKNRSYPSFHSTKYFIVPNILETVDIGMISQFAIDPMHLIDLGVVKKMLTLLIGRQTIEFKLSHDAKNKIDSKLLNCASSIPLEFARKPRSINDLRLWKATELRQFILYTGIVVLKDLVCDDIYSHFLLLHCAYRLMSHADARNHISLVQKMLSAFVRKFPKIYGHQRVSYNVHVLLHLADCISQYGCVDSFSAYKFENFMQVLKKLVRKPSLILQQLVNRIDELQMSINLIEKLPQHTSSKSNSFKFDDFKLNNNEADKCCCLEGDIPFLISEFINQNGITFVIGRRFKEESPFFTRPLNSQLTLGIIKCNAISENNEIFPVTAVRFNMDSQDIMDLDFQNEVTTPFQGSSKKFVYVDPGRVSPKYYHESWTMSEKHMPPPPLTLLTGRRELITPLKTKTINYKMPNDATNNLLPPSASPNTPVTESVTSSNVTQSLCCCSQEIKKIHNKIDVLTYLVKDMSRRIVHDKHGKICSRSVTSDIELMFPLNTLKNIEELEARCGSIEFREEVTNHLISLVSLGKGLSVAFQNTIHDDLALKINFSGTQNKISFKKFKRLNAIIFEAWKSPLDSTESFQNKLKIEFRRAHNRVHNKKLRLK